MATTQKINSSSSSSSLLEIFSKPHHFLLFFGLLFILAAFVTSSASDMASNLPSHETLFAAGKVDAAAKTTSTVEFHPNYEKGTLNPRHASRSKSSSSSKGKNQFKASDHEVPSGPNPISNR